MLRALSRPATRLMERWLPDAFIFVLVLTIVAALAAVIFEANSPIAVIRMWGDGFWKLLEFSMQMLLVLVTGYILASSPPVKALLARLAGLRVLLTQMTPTGMSSGRELFAARFGERVVQTLLPYDYPFAMRRFLAAWRPCAGLVMETELWPNLCAAACRA